MKPLQYEYAVTINGQTYALVDNTTSESECETCDLLVCCTEQPICVAITLGYVDCMG